MADGRRVPNCVECGHLNPPKRRKYCGVSCANRGQRRSWILANYGITLEEYDEILKFQDNRCGVCNRVYDPKTPFHVDHEHGGHVRGLLCFTCNSRLVGRLKDHAIAQRLADYLRDPPATSALGREVIAPGVPRKRKRKRGATSRLNPQSRSRYNR